MNSIDKAINKFYIINDGKEPNCIYVGYNVLNEMRMNDKHWRMDLAAKTYSGIPYHHILGDPDHLAVY